MHAIEAVCVIQQLPVAPLHWVVRAHGEPRKVFANDPLESREILDKRRFDTMYVVAREYHYSMTEFEKIHQNLEMLIAKAPQDGRLMFFGTWQSSRSQKVKL